MEAVVPEVMIAPEENFCRNVKLLFLLLYYSFQKIAIDRCDISGLSQGKKTPHLREGSAEKRLFYQPDQPIVCGCIFEFKLEECRVGMYRKFQQKVFRRMIKQRNRGLVPLRRALRKNINDIISFRPVIKTGKDGG